MNTMRKTLAALLAASMTLAVLPSATAVTPSDNATDTSGVTVTDQDGDGVIRVACVGDSITAGTTATNYPMYLQEYLNYLGAQNGNTYEVKNHGKGGAACRHVEEEVVANDAWSNVVDENGDGWAYFYYDDISYRSSLTYTPDVVIVQMGTNDALFGNWDNWDNYYNDDYYNYLVKPYADKGALVVMSTSPYAENGWHDANVNGPVHDKQVALAHDLGLPIVDTNRLLYGMPEILADGLHGNVTGYSMMAMNFYKYIFGGESITLTLESEPQTRVDMVNTANGRAYCRVTDETGKASIDFLPGDYSFETSAECTGYKKAYMNVSFNGSTTVTYELEVGGFNVALTGTPFDCGVATYGGSHNSDSLNDAERTDGGYQPADYKSGNYCGIELDDTYMVNMIVLYWENASYVGTFENDGYNLYFLENGNWNLVSKNSVTVTRATYSGDTVADSVVLSQPKAIDGVKVEFLDGGADHKVAQKLYELEILADDPTPISPADPAGPGDVDGNGTIDAADLTALAKHVAGIEEITDAKLLAAADVDGNAVVDAADLTKLAKHVAGIEEIVLPA